jgi:hypothetical protein
VNGKAIKDFVETKIREIVNKEDHFLVCENEVFHLPLEWETKWTITENKIVFIKDGRSEIIFNIDWCNNITDIKEELQHIKETLFVAKKV